MHSRGHQPSQRASTPRSSTGCWTCRARKVKCDELKPKCGRCMRLGKACDWIPRWKFRDQTKALARIEKHVSRTNCPAWDDGARLHARPDLTQSASPKDACMDDILSCEISRNPGSLFNIILTPESFLPPSTRRGSVEWADSSASRDTVSLAYTSSVSSLVLLHDLDNDCLFLESLEPSTPRVFATSTTITEPLDTRSGIPSDLVSRNNKDDSYYVLYYQTVVSKRLMPGKIGTQIEGIGGITDVIALHSKTFRPLHHAICAISMLCLALNGRCNVLEDAFRHYDHAICACIQVQTESSATPCSQSMLYLHFVLMFFDIYCASLDFWREKQIWATHLNPLACFAYNSNSINEFQAHLLWCILQLDLNSCLAGDTDAGQFVQAYKVHGWQTPFLDYLRPASMGLVSQTHDTIIFQYCLKLEHLVCEKLVHLGQLAAELRENYGTKSGSILDIQCRVSRLGRELHSCWQKQTSASLSLEFDRMSPGLAVTARTMFDTSCIQYYTAMLYLNTITCQGQRCDHSILQQSDLDQHSKQTLTLASSMIQAGDTGQYRLILPIFLAGMVSSDGRDRSECSRLLQSLSKTYPSSNALKIERFLTKVYAAQDLRRFHGISVDREDWIKFARECGIRNVSLGILEIR